MVPVRAASPIRPGPDDPKRDLMVVWFAPKVIE
jgi:hypothetical protein